MAIEIDDLAAVIAKELVGYAEEVTQKVKKAIDEETKEGVKRLIASSPKKTGDYAAGWTSKESYEGKYSKLNTVHNKTDYQLTHLLENGHVKRGGGRVRAVPHIEIIEKQTIENVTRKVEDAISGNS